VARRHKCGKTFGIMHFALSARQAAEEERREAEESAALRRKEVSATARAARASRDSEDSGVDMVLGQFIISEECPCCGGIFTEGHKAHLDKCRKVHPTQTDPRCSKYERAAVPLYSGGHFLFTSSLLRPVSFLASTN
jgi:hypothetical protein